MQINCSVVNYLIYSSEKDHLQSIKRDIYSASKAICLAQDQAGKTSLECENLEKEISTLVSEIQDMKSKLAVTREKIKEEGRVQQGCREKMERHKVGTEEVERCCPVQQELGELKRKITDLKDKRECDNKAKLVELATVHACLDVEHFDTIRGSSAHR